MNVRPAATLNGLILIDITLRSWSKNDDFDKQSRLQISPESTVRNILKLWFKQN